MAQCFNKEKIVEECKDVRDDKTDTNWVAYVYEDKNIVLAGSGVDHEELFDLMRENNDRVYAFVRVQVGDDMSKRMKFVSTVFIGENVKPINKARCSTDQQAIKDAFPITAVTVQFDGQPESLDFIIRKVREAGGANYDAQI